MNPPAPPGRPYWLLVVLAGLVFVPSTWAVAALIAGATLVIVRSGLNHVLARRAREADARAAEGAAIVLGLDRARRQVLLSDRQLSAHGLILGASGAGKTSTLMAILTDQIRRGRPVVALDMKGSPAVARELANAAVAAGRPLRVWTLDGPERWNPLAHGNATELKDKLIGMERFTEPHYQRAAERYAQTVLRVLREARPTRPVELDEVVGLMEPSRLIGMLRALDPARAQQVREYVAGLTPDQLSAVRGLATRLAIMSESHTGPFLSPSSPLGAGAPTAGRVAAAPVDVRDALAGGDVLLFSLNSSRYGKLAAQIGTLVVQDLTAAAGQRLEGAAVPPQAVVGIDEFSALGADHVISLLARGRESGISVLLATQELADLDRAAPGFRDQVIGITALKIAHRQDVPASAQLIAQMAGTEQTWEETRQIGGGLGRSGYGRGTRRLVEQFILHPNEIKSLRTGEAVVISKLPVANARIVRITAHASRDAGAPARSRTTGPSRPARNGPEL